MPTTTLTEVEKIRNLPWLSGGDALNIGFVLLTFSGPVFLLFLNELGLDEAQIGVMLAIVPFFGIISPFVAPIVTRFGYKRVFVTFRGTRTLVIAMLLLTPWFYTNYGEQAAFIWVAVIIGWFAIWRAIGETGGLSWRKEIIPDSIRSKFGAINSMIVTVVSISVVTIASYVIDYGKTGLTRFMVLITVGIGMGLLSAWCFSHVPAEESVQRRKEGAMFQGMRQALHNRDFLLYLGGFGLVATGGLSIISFIPLFMKEEVGLSEGRVVLLSVGTYSGALLTSFLWGWTADRYGSKPIMQTGVTLLLLLPVAWFLTPRNSILSLPVAMLIAFFAGVATLAWEIGWSRYLYVNATPIHNRAPYMALFFAWWGLASGLGPILAGQILTFTQGLSGGLHLDPYTPLFVMSIMLVFPGLIVISQLRPDDATPFRRFTGMFLRGNMVRALESLIQYNFAGDETARLEITERMGDARSPLSNNELIEALSDPSFNVRYQAVNSIGRMQPDPELVDALLKLLNEEPSELSFAVTRSLGRLGDERAIKPLRQYLFSGYHLLEANAARALAMLNDKDSIPDLMKKLKHEPSPTLRVAYATALGKLQATKAIGSLFGLLRELESDVQRGEVGLALARIAGDERYYMQQWRAVRNSPTTATAQAILALQKLSSKPDFIAATKICADYFAEDNRAQGATTLKEILGNFPTNGLDQTLITILHECANGLASYSDTRPEFLILALHTLDIALRQTNN
jgi:MFS family permease